MVSYPGFWAQTSGIFNCLKLTIVYRAIPRKFK